MFLHRFELVEGDGKQSKHVECNCKIDVFCKTPPYQQPVSRQQRVLSDSYLQKSGSIGKRSRACSQNNLLVSKKRANRRTNDSNKDILSRYAEQKSFSLDMKFKIGILDTEMKDRENLSPRKIIVLKPNCSNTLSGWEAKKQLLERLKMTKVSQERQSCNLGEIFSLNNTKSTTRFGSSIGVTSTEGQKHESVVKLPIFKRSNFSSSLTKKPVKTTACDVKPSSWGPVNLMPTNSQKNLLVSDSSNPLFVSCIKDAGTDDGDTKEGCSSNLSDISSQQDLIIRSHEDGLVVSSNCNCKQEHSDHSKVEAYQHSPNSVLEPPFREDNSSSSEYCESSSNDLHDLWMEDDFGPEMTTSSDDERSCSGQTLQSTIPFGAKESRDFSYLVDVLDESGFQDGNVEIRFEKWHSSECMASQSVFETLEKKYGKQELWHKSERKLLFDRINSGMIEILRPRIDIRVCYNPLQRKMRNMSRRDVIEEELSMFLVNQEEGVNDGVSEKAVGRGPWFDPVDEIDSLVTEIEFFLFEKLTAELVNV